MSSAGALDIIREALQGRYRIERQVAVGGMATVYLGLDERHHRRVAVKVLHLDLARAIGMERFQREIEIAARLNHPHIVPLLDSGELPLGPGLPVSAFYVMPFVEGESLRERLAREGKIPPAEAVRLAREVADALDYAHQHGIVHRDIKPENILLSGHHAVVTDFGIARAVDHAGAATITQTGTTLGTPGYMSPEQVTGDAPIDGRSDLYALGCVLFEMLVGHPPWTGSGARALMKRLAESPPRLRTFDPTLPREVDEAVFRVLARDPAQRFQTPEDFSAALGGELRDGTGFSPHGLPAAGPGTRVLRWAGLLGITIALVTISILLFRRAQPAPAETISTLAMTPLEGQFAGNQDDYLSEGIEHAVADLLRQLPQLRLTAPSLVAQVRRQRPELNDAELGAYLKVGAVLTWKLRRIGDSLYLRAELLRVPRGEFLWSASIARPMAEILALQESVASTIAESLRLELSGADRARLARRPTMSAVAYDYYLRGRHFYTLAVPGPRIRDYLDSTAAYGKRALETDSAFAGGWALLGSYYSSLAIRGFRAPFGVYMDSGAYFYSQALQADSTQALALADLGARLFYYADDLVGAGRHLERATRLAPTDPLVWFWYAIYLGEVEGRLDSALAAIRRSVNLDPSPQNLNTLGDLFMRARRYDSALVALRHGIERDSTVAGLRMRLVTVYERTGDYPAAITARRAFSGEAAERFEQAYRRSGATGYGRVLREERLARVDSLTRLVGGPRVYPRDTLPSLPETRIALLYGQLGEWQKAMDWIERERRIRPRRFRLWVVHPDMEGLRTEPRFLAAVREEGLEGLLRSRNR